MQASDHANLPVQRRSNTIGHKRDGQLLARDKVELGRALGAMGLVLMKAVNLDEQEVGSKYKGSIGTRELIDFTHHLIMIFSSGIPLMVGLRDIPPGDPERELPQGAWRTSSEEWNRGSRCRTRSPLSAHLRQPRYISILRAGEESGARSRRCSQQLVEHLEWKEGTRATIVQAMILPVHPDVAVTADRPMCSCSRCSCRSSRHVRRRCGCGAAP
jgi:type II secretory pathway component PulF